MMNAPQLSTPRAIEQCLTYCRGVLSMEKKPLPPLSIYFEGEPGVGKTAIPHAIGRILNYRVVVIHANRTSPDNAGGTLLQDMATRRTEWFAPYWMPDEDGTVHGLNPEGKPYAGTILLFDELASADDRVRKPLFSVFLERCLNGRPLPWNCLVMATGNEAETGTMVNDLDNATRTRFITLKIIADFQSWMEEYAPGDDITATTIVTLKNNVGIFCETEKALEDDRDLYGNPRSWTQCSEIERAIMQTKEDRKDEAKRASLKSHVAGKVGVENALFFMGAFDSTLSMTSLFDLLAMTPAQRAANWPKNLGQLHALTYSMMAYPTDIATAKQILSLADEMPAEEGDVNFQDTKPALLEMIFQNLYRRGFKEDLVQTELATWSAKDTQQAFDAGPLLGSFTG